MKNLAERIDPSGIEGSQGMPAVAIVESRRSYEVALYQIGGTNARSCPEGGISRFGA
jgi:hypothetical protein